MQQQPPQPPPSNIPLSAITADQIQKHLEDNKNLILAILECQNLGKYQECAQYQAVLQKNLMYLAAIADAQPPASQQQPNPSLAMQTPPNSMPQASSFMQQPGGGSSSGSGQNSMFLVNSRQAQEQQQQQQMLQLQLQQQQQFWAQMGFRGGGQSGLFGMQSGGREGGSEAAYGGDGRGMFFGGGGFRD